MSKSPEENPTPGTVNSVHEAALDSAIDWNLARQSIPGDEATFLDYVKLFREESTRHVASIQEAAERSDLVELRRAAHTLKSGADLFSARRVFEAAFQLEAMVSGDEPLKKCDQLMWERIDSLNNEWKILDLALEVFLADSDQTSEDSEYAEHETN